MAAYPLRLAPAGSDGRPAWLLAVGLSVYLVLQLGLQIFAFSGRAVPVEYDDAYTYLSKAAQMADGCFRQDCPALRSLDDQFAHDDIGPGQEWRRYQAEARSFLVYHPVHSLLAWGLHATGLSWETTYFAIVLFGVVLIGGGLALFLSAIWGAATAGGALMIIGLTLFAGQGLHNIVPTNLATGVGFLAWGLVLKWRERVRWAVLPLIVVMIGLHPTGRLFGAATLALLFLTDARPLTFRKVLPYLVGVTIIVVAFLLPLIVDRPLLRVDLGPSTQPFVRELAQHLLAVLWAIVSWDHRLVGLVIFAAAYLTFRTMASTERRPILTVLGLFVLLAAASVFVVIPLYPAELFVRLWIVPEVILCGAAARFLIDFTAEATGGEGERHRGVLLVRAIVVTFIATGLWQIADTSYGMNQTHFGTRYDTAQVERLAQSCGTAFYSDSTVLLAFLTHGAFACSSRYAPIMADTANTHARLAQLPRPFFLVAAQPAPRELWLTGFGRIIITLREVPKTGALWLRFAGASPGATVKLSGGGQERQLEIPGDNVWLKVPTDGLAAGTILTLTGSGFFSSVYLTGLRVDPSDAWSWPWNHGVSLQYRRFRRPLFEFDARIISAGLFTSLDPLDENGSSMLARIGDE